MGRGKRIAIIAVLILIIGSFVLVPLMKSSGAEEGVDKLASFTFVENLAVSYKQRVPISFEVKSDDVKKASLYLNDSLLKTWESPKGKIEFILNAGLFGIGAKTISLVSVSSNGMEYDDTRLLRIVSDVAPKQMKATVLAMFDHDPTSFTQGFEFNNGVLFESTGLNGKSKVAQVDLKSGKSLKQIGLDENYFGEGITIVGDKIFQLTWQNQKCFQYNKNSLQLEKEFPYNGEGWGLCNDGKNIIMSNGSEILTFRDPESFQTVKTIEVYDQIGPRVRLNELEYIDGKIYANIWMLDIIIVIDPETGKVLSEIDCSDVVAKGKGAGEVLNGIAYNLATKKTYLTGKNWSKVLEVEIK